MIKVKKSLSFFNFDKYICSAGIPTESFEMPTSNLKEVYKHVDNEVIYIDMLSILILIN